MNRVALGIVLAVAAAVGVVFGVHANFDIDLSRLFFDPDLGLFPAGGEPFEQMSRQLARGLITLIVMPSFIAIVGKLVLPNRRMLVSGSTALFLTLTLAIGPGLITNLILKDHWGRSRPIDIQAFGGTDRFTAWWDPSGPCPNNCSFVAGEPSGAFWTLAVAAVAPPQWRVVAYGAAVIFGIAIGVLRMAAGGHFFTDVAFAGVFMYLVAWVMHGLIFRWRATRLNKDTVERVLAWPSKKMIGTAPSPQPTPSRSPEDRS
jgi:lipid A 4'-phosphatase